MSVVGNLGSPSKDTVSTSGSLVESENLPRDFSRLSLFSSGSATSQDEQFRCEGHAEHSLSCMQNYLQAGKLCDVTLIAGSNGKKVQAHRYTRYQTFLFLFLVTNKLIISGLCYQLLVSTSPLCSLGVYASRANLK